MKWVHDELGPIVQKLSAQETGVFKRRKLCISLDEVINTHSNYTWLGQQIFCFIFLIKSNNIGWIFD